MKKKNTSKKKKVVIVGDDWSGKTSMVFAMAHNRFDEDHRRPPVSEVLTVSVVVDTQPVDLVLWDTVGSEEYGRLRTLAYHEMDVVLICFALDGRETLESVQSKWDPELKSLIPGSPCILVGLKQDLRTSDRVGISPQEGLAVATSINAVEYVECSALASEGISTVLEHAARAALSYNRPTSSERKRGREKGGCTVV